MTDTDEATKMVRILIPVMAVLLLFVLSVTVALYEHPMPAKDCSKPYDYPICSRAGSPTLFVPWGTSMLFLGIIFAAILAIIIAYAAYHATVIEQATIITPTATIGKASASSSASQSATSTSTPAASPATSASGKLLPPTTKPAQGVDLAALK